MSTATKPVMASEVAIAHLEGFTYPIESEENALFEKYFQDTKDVRVGGHLYVSPLDQCHRIGISRAAASADEEVFQGNRDETSINQMYESVVRGTNEDTDVDDLTADVENFSIEDRSEAPAPNRLKSEENIQAYIRSGLKSSWAFCFIKCLDKHDQDLFVALYASLLFQNCPIIDRRKEILDFGGIKLGQWLEIMMRLAPHLNYKYDLYRRAYWGENAGRTKVSTKSVDYVVHLRAIGEGSKSRCVLFDEGHLSAMELYSVKVSRRHSSEADADAMSSTVFEEKSSPYCVVS